MMQLLEHPQSFSEGARCLWLQARHKDGFEQQRRVVRISRDHEQFMRKLDELHQMAVPGERIYGCVDARNLQAAAKRFQHCMIDEGETFWPNLMRRWESALMHPTSRAGKLWLWDCDEPGDVEEVRACLPPEILPLVYEYPTRSGAHIITPTFDRRRASVRAFKCWNDNAMMLWGF